MTENGSIYTARRKNRVLNIVLRLSITGLCFGMLFQAIEPVELWRYLSDVEIPSLAIAVLLHSLIVVLLGWRWRCILKVMGTDCRLAAAVDMTFVATFFNLVLPFSIGGDLYRMWLSRRIGINMADTVPGTVMDRLAGLIALGLMVLFTAAALPEDAVPWEVRTLMIVLLPAMMASTWLFVGLLPRLRLKWGTIRHVSAACDKLRAAYERRQDVLAILCQSLAAHLLAVAIVVAIADGLALNLGVADAFLLVPAMLLSTMLPISLGGWGVREAVAIPLLALAGVSASGAITLALLFGVTQIVAGATGTLYFFWTSTTRERQTFP